MASKEKKIYLVIPAYNVAPYISNVIKRIPKPVMKKVSKIVIVNDASNDNTLKIIQKLADKNHKILILDNPTNLGYAKVQKNAFLKALAAKADIVCLLHGDGQYAPEELPKLLEPLENESADLVQGSRILEGGALKGHMPLYKYIANIILSKIENLAFGMNIAEFHSGYMLYSKKALMDIPFVKLSNTFHFDGEMLLMAHKKNLRISQIGIQTSYAGEISNLKPISYGFDVLKIICLYKLGKYNF